MDRYQTIFTISLVFIFLQIISCHAAATETGAANNIDQEDIGGFSVSSGANNELRPCSYKGTIYSSGQTWDYDECITCVCDNSTVVCTLQYCPIIDCMGEQVPVTTTGKCCETCPDPSKTITLSSSKKDGCTYRNKTLPVGGDLVVDECTTCVCQDTYDVKCEIRSCPRIFCDEPIRFDGECCPICRYNLGVLYVVPSDLPSIRARRHNNLVFDLIITSYGRHGNIKGNGLIKVSAWAADNNGNRVGYIDQVLSAEQADKDIIRLEPFGDYNFTIDEIEFALDASDAACSQMEYLCVELAKGDNATVNDQRVPFTVEGIVSETNKSSAPKNLVGCVPFPSCEDPGTRNQVSFSVSKKSGQIDHIAYTLSTWTDEFNNVGDAFNSETGVFTCPETGSYFFTYKIAEKPRSRVPRVELMKNDDPVLAGISNSNSIIVDLEVDNIVWLRVQGELYGSPEIFSTFSGFLI